MSSDGPNSSAPIARLGAFWMVYGIIRILAAVCLVIFSGTATLMFGALLNRVPNPFALMRDFHFFYTAMILLSALGGILGFLAGLALLAGNGSGRVLALIAAFLSLSNLPLGTTLGIYTLVVLLPVSPAQLHRRTEPAA
jgi:hypothetical protein